MLKEVFFFLQWFVRHCCYPVRHFLPYRKTGTSACICKSNIHSHLPLQTVLLIFTPKFSNWSKRMEFKCLILVGQFQISSFFNLCGMGFPLISLSFFLDLLSMMTTTEQLSSCITITSRHRAWQAALPFYFFFTAMNQVFARISQ